MPAQPELQTDQQQGQDGQQKLDLAALTAAVERLMRRDLEIARERLGTSNPPAGGAR